MLYMQHFFYLNTYPKHILTGEPIVIHEHSRGDHVLIRCGGMPLANGFLAFYGTVNFSKTIMLNTFGVPMTF